MSSAKDYVDDGSVDWTALATGVVGTWATAYVLYVIEVIDLAGEGVEWVVTGSLEWFARLVGGLSSIPGEVLNSAWSSAAEFVAQLGAFGLPVAALIAFASMFVLYLFLEVVLFG